MKSGVTVRFAEDKDDLVEFYDIFSETRHRLGLPTFPFKLFDMIWCELNPIHSRLILAEYNREIIGGAILLFYGKWCEYYLAGYRSMYSRYQTNNIILWESIKYATKKGVRIFSMGGTPKFHHGLIRFKKNFGAQFSPIYYYTNLQKDIKKQNPWASFVWKNLPKYIHLRLSPVIMREFGL